MKRILLFFAVIALISTGLRAQDVSLPDLPGFKKVTSYPVYVPDNLWDFMNGAADNYLSFGFIDLHVAEYKKGKNTIKLEIYRHRDNIMAFGIYSSERSSSFNFVNLGAQGYKADGAINFFKGNFYVKIRTFSKKEKIIQASESLARRVENSLAGESKMPEMLSMFPAEGKKVNEETYINESVLGHNFLNKAFRAIYEVGPDNFSVFIFRSATPEETVSCARTYIASTGIDPVETGEGKYVLSDGYNGPVFLAWKDATMVIISGLAKDQAEIADRYTSEILE